jgi:hypothetical protein
LHGYSDVEQSLLQGCRLQHDWVDAALRSSCHYLIQQLRHRLSITPAHKLKEFGPQVKHVKLQLLQACNQQAAL